MERVVRERTSGAPAHPNDVDRRRIERALKARKRYRYVSPRVAPATGGYRIESPCCSRNIDPDGGIVDVALLRCEAPGAEWQLFRKDHGRGIWQLHGVYSRLAELLEVLNADPERKFWQ